MIRKQIRSKTRINDKETDTAQSSAKEGLEGELGDTYKTQSRLKMYVKNCRKEENVPFKVV